MKFQLGDRHFEIGGGHEVVSCFMTFDEHGFTQSVSLHSKDGGLWAALNDPDVKDVGKLPVGVYELQG